MKNAFRELIRAGLAAGYTCSVWDGGEWQVKRSRSLSACVDAVRSVDEAELRFRDESGAIVDMAERVDRGSTEDEHESARNEAARWAYGRAEHEAEIAREDDAKFRASEDIEDARAEIHDTNKLALALLREIRGNQYTENVCAALRHRLQEFLADRKRLFARIAEREANYWSAVRY
jgi:hypothetical protein